MTTLSPPTKTAYGIWRYDWTGTGPYRVYSYGLYQFIEEETDDEFIYLSSTGNIEPPAIEVFDSTETDDIPQGEQYQSRFIIQWRGYQYADYYTIQKETAPSTWTDVQTYIEDGRGYYKFQSTIESSDYTEPSYRVILTDKAGATSTTEFSYYVARNPDPPELTYTYNAGTGLLTIAAA